ncbi:MAG: hypothetical protein V2A58_07440 [Planctomycetota bacterium]
MPSHMHIEMGRWSLKALGARQRAFWRSVEDELPELCTMPDRYFAEPEKWRRYVALPGGHVLPHGPTDAQFTDVSFAHHGDRRVARFALSHLIGELVRALRANDPVESARFGGSLAHYVQDCSGPAHVVNHYLLLRLVPPPARLRNIHRPLDDVSVPRPPRFRPRVLGTCVPEIAFHAEAELQRIVELALAAVVPALQAIRARKGGVLPSLLSPSCHAAVRLVSSLWHTCFCVARGAIAQSALRGLRAVPLSERRPDDAFTLDPYPWEPRRDAGIHESGALLPLRLRVSRGGRSYLATFRDGLAMVHGHAFFRIPAGVYRAFSVRIGILARPPQAGKVVFRVVLGDSPPSYESGTARILDMGGRVARTVTLSASSLSRAIRVPLGRARGIALLADASPFATHVAWVHPVLLK